MLQPTILDDSDPLLGRVRAICLAYPDAVEVPSWGRSTFRAGKRIFVVMSAGMDRPYSIVFKPDVDERLAFVQDDRFFVPPYWGPSGWLAIDLDRPDTDWAELAEIIDTSYRQVALKRQLRALDAKGSLPLV